MKYNFPEDIKSIREILGLSQSEFAEQIGVEQVTISRNELGKTEPSAKILESVYTFAFAKNIKINKLKEMLWRDDLRKNEKLLFHGAKSEIDGEIDIRRGRYNNDFGQGFYTGESYEQAIERILEAKGMLADENAELERQYEIFKRIRMQRAEE